MKKKGDIHMKIGIESIKYIDEYAYLGKILSFYNSHKEINGRILQARKKFWSISFILLDKS